MNKKSDPLTGWGWCISHTNHLNYPVLVLVDMWTRQKKTHRIPIQNAAGTGEAEKFQCSAIVAGNCRKMNQNKKRIIQDLGFSGDRINPH